MGKGFLGFGEGDGIDPAGSDLLLGRGLFLQGRDGGILLFLGGSDLLLDRRFLVVSHEHILLANHRARNGKRARRR